MAFGPGHLDGTACPATMATADHRHSRTRTSRRSVTSDRDILTLQRPERRHDPLPLCQATRVVPKKPTPRAPPGRRTRLTPHHLLSFDALRLAPARWWSSPKWPDPNGMPPPRQAFPDLTAKKPHAIFRVPTTLAHSSRGPDAALSPAVTTGSNPVCATNPSRGSPSRR